MKGVRKINKKETEKIRNEAKDFFDNMGTEEFEEIMGDMIIDKADDERILIGKTYQEILEIINEQIYSGDISKLADVARELLDCSWYAEYT